MCVNVCVCVRVFLCVCMFVDEREGGERGNIQERRQQMEEKDEWCVLWCECECVGVCAIARGCR